MPLSKLSVQPGWVLRFVPFDVDPSSQVGSISSSQFYINLSLAQISASVAANHSAKITSHSIAGPTSSAASTSDNGGHGGNSGGLSTGAKAGIGVGAAVGAICVFALGCYLARHFAKPKTPPEPTLSPSMDYQSSVSPSSGTPGPGGWNWRTYQPGQENNPLELPGSRRTAELDAAKP